MFEAAVWAIGWRLACAETDLPALPATFSLGIAIVHHPGAHVGRISGGALDRFSTIKVKEAEDKEFFSRGRPIWRRRTITC